MVCLCWALLVWPIRLFLLTYGPYSQAYCAHVYIKTRKTRERERGFWVWFLLLLPLPWLLKPIETSVSKLYGFTFNNLFRRFLWGEVGFVKLLININLVFFSSLLYKFKLSDKLENRPWIWNLPQKFNWESDWFE